MSAVTPAEVLAILGPVSAVLVHEMVRTDVSMAELRDALRRLRHGELDEYRNYASLDARRRRVIDLLDIACEGNGSGPAGISAADRSVGR